MSQKLRKWTSVAISYAIYAGLHSAARRPSYFTTSTGSTNHTTEINLQLKNWLMRLKN